MICDCFESPLGRMQLCCDGHFLTAITFYGQKYEDTHILKDVTYQSHPVLEEAKVWLSQYFQGNIPTFLPAMKPSGTPFQQKVWDLLLQIPYGKTITYGELAQQLGCKSAQAVGGAVGRNPISILIPCHRVMGADGKLTGYVGGLEKKEFLLLFEKSY